MVAWGQEIGRKDRLQRGFKGGYVHYLDCGDGFTDLYICQNSPNCTL